MSARGFVETSERYGGNYRAVAQVVCRTCGTCSSIGIKAEGGLLPPNVIEKKFEQKGWVVGKNPKWDYCPECARKERTKILKVVHSAESKIADQRLEPPREMTRDDRRVIFAKLDEVYLDEKRGYERGWSDQRVASDLGVPRKWVEIVRAENFGEMGANEDMTEYLSQAEALCKEARAALEEARKCREQVEALMKNPGFLSLGAVSDRLSKVERLAVEVKKLVLVP